MNLCSSHRFWMALLICLILLLSPAAATHAKPIAPSPSNGWEELRTQYFAIIYPSNYEMLAQLMLASYGQVLDDEYERFSAVFDYQLNTPVSIRVYENLSSFKNLNPLTPAVNDLTTHSHIGYREIALIGQNITADPKWSVSAVNHIRYELAILFVEQLADLKAPPGLLAGIGRYAQDPQLGDEIRADIQTAGSAAPADSWRSNLEEGDASIQSSTQIAAASVVAHLVDRYSWFDFLTFLRAIATSDSYLEALFATYQIDSDTLQIDWLANYQKYIEGGWENSIFYEFDLSPYEKLIEAGAYTDASQDLTEVIQLLEKTGQTMKLEQAQVLMESSRIGQQASEKALQARQAMISGDFDLTIQRSQEARDLFVSIGDQRRLEELDTYTARAVEIQELRAEVDTIAARALLQANPLRDVPRLLQIGERLSALQDPVGVSQVNKVLETVRGVQVNRRMFLLVAAGIGIAVLLGLRIWLSFRPVPIEVLR